MKVYILIIFSLITINLSAMQQLNIVEFEVPQDELLEKRLMREITNMLDTQLEWAITLNQQLKYEKKSNQSILWFTIKDEAEDWLDEKAGQDELNETIVKRLLIFLNHFSEWGVEHNYWFNAWWAFLLNRQLLLLRSSLSEQLQHTQLQPIVVVYNLINSFIQEHGCPPAVFGLQGHQEMTIENLNYIKELLVSNEYWLEQIQNKINKDVAQEIVRPVSPTLVKIKQVTEKLVKN